MQITALMVWVYAAVVLLGGVMGWVKARSKASVYSGLTFGVLLILCGLAMWDGRRIGLTTATGIAVALTVIMGVRFAKSKKFMPAGLMAGLSAVMVVVLVMAL